MPEVPEALKEGWVFAFSQVLSRLSLASSEEEQVRALKWLCFLPQALLREPRRGGARGQGQGAGAIAKRFNLLCGGEWGGLVSLWEGDGAKSRERDARRQLFRERDSRWFRDWP